MTVKRLSPGVTQVTVTLTACNEGTRDRPAWACDVAIGNCIGIAWAKHRSVAVAKALRMAARWVLDQPSMIAWRREGK